MLVWDVASGGGGHRAHRPLIRSRAPSRKSTKENPGFKGKSIKENPSSQENPSCKPDRMQCYFVYIFMRNARQRGAPEGVWDVADASGGVGHRAHRPLSGGIRCRANMAHIRQPRPDAGLGFQAKGIAPTAHSSGRIRRHLFFFSFRISQRKLLHKCFNTTSQSESFAFPDSQKEKTGFLGCGLMCARFWETQQDAGWFLPSFQICARRFRV